MTGLCQRPIVHNRTRPVVLGAYWTVTGRCLHRVRSCDHCVRSSHEKRISPFLTVRSDLVFFFFSSLSSAAPNPRHNLAAAAAVQRHRCRAAVHARAQALHRSRAHHRSRALHRSRARHRLRARELAIPPPQPSRRATTSTTARLCSLSVHRRRVLTLSAARATARSQHLLSRRPNPRRPNPSRSLSRGYVSASVLVSAR
jgi:hypothetical protein